MFTDAIETLKLKIERANLHIHELEREIEAYRQTKPYSLKPDTDPSTGNEIIHLDLPEIIPPNLSVITGDVLHNLRSALDQLACRLAELSGVSNTKGVYFPFGRSSEEFETSAKEKIRKLNISAQTFIRNLRPYNGGNDLLWSLHVLNIMDKHRLLVPVGSLANINGVPVGAPLYELMAPDFDAIQEGMTQVPLRLTPIFNYNIQFTFDIAFRDIEPIKDQSVLTTLNRQSNLVSEILNLAQREFF
jgi:hypothetical protein